MGTDLDLSIIIPAYNEARRIVPTLDRVYDWLIGYSLGSEIIVVDDGSRDDTSEVVRSMIPKFEASQIKFRVLGDGINRGKGASVRMGMLAAVGHIALFTDADLSSPIEEAPKLIDPIIAGQTDVAIGSRDLIPDLIGIHQSRFRETAGRTFNLLMRIVTGLPFKDTQCGFKAFRRDAARDIFSRLQIDRFGFDVEALYVARKLGYRTLEVPVVWNHVEGTSVNLLNGLVAFADPLRVRFNDLRGLYKQGALSSRSASSLAK